MLSFLRLLLRRKRAYERAGRTSRLMLFSPSGYLGPATTFDESEGGVGLTSSCGRLDEVSHILNPHRATATKVRLAWRSADKAGFEYLHSSNLRGYVADPELAHIRQAWMGLAQRHGLVAPGGAFTRAR